MGRSGPTLASRFLSEIPAPLTGKFGGGSARGRPGSRVITEDVWQSSGIYSSESPPSAAETFQIGDSVRHTAFGEGVIISLDYSASDCEVTVQFAGGLGAKRLLLSFAPLQKIE